MDNFFQVVDERRSTKVYDPQVEIPREELVSLLETAGKAPSAWNLQQWKFLVFDNKEVQERLLPIAYHQHQVHDASAVVAILGDLEANKNIDPVFDPAIEKGEMTTPKLTSMDQVLQSMGYEGAGKLIDIMEGNLEDPIHTKFIPKIIVRQST